LGFALAAPHILPFAMHLPHTVRYHQMSDGNQQDSAVSGGVFNARRAHFLKGALNPHAFGCAPYSNRFFVPLGGGGYAGVVALAGTAIALVLRIPAISPPAIAHSRPLGLTGVSTSIVPVALIASLSGP